MAAVTGQTAVAGFTEEVPQEAEGLLMLGESEAYTHADWHSKCTERCQCRPWSGTVQDPCWTQLWSQAHSLQHTQPLSRVSVDRGSGLFGTVTADLCGI